MPEDLVSAGGFEWVVFGQVKKKKDRGHSRKDKWLASGKST